MRQSLSAGQVKTVLVSQLSLHWYSHVLFWLHTHSPGQRSGAVVAVQSHAAWHGPPRVEAPQEKHARRRINQTGRIR